MEEQRIIQEQNINSGNQTYFENLFEVWRNLLEPRLNIEAKGDMDLFSKEMVVGNVTPKQEKDLIIILDFIGDLKELGLYEAIPPFLNKALSVLNLSRSRNGMQQEMFTTQTLKRSYSDQEKEKKRRFAPWGKN